MGVKLHRCSLGWFKMDLHPCWRVERALRDEGIEYETVTGPLLPGNRDELARLSGQNKYPTIEFEDARVYRAESNDMAERIRAGKLFETDGAA